MVFYEIGYISRNEVGLEEMSFIVEPSIIKRILGIRPSREHYVCIDGRWFNKFNGNVAVGLTLETLYQIKKEIRS